MTPCETSAGLIDAWLDGELSAADVASLERHAGTCDACRAAWNNARQLMQDLATLGRAAERICTEPADRTPLARTSPSAAAGPGFASKSSRAWRIAAAIVFAATITLAVWRFGPPIAPTSIDAFTKALPRPALTDPVAVEVADAEQIVLKHPSHGMAVQFATKSPDVQVVWLYGPAPESDAGSTTDAPGT